MLIEPRRRRVPCVFRGPAARARYLRAEPGRDDPHDELGGLRDTPDAGASAHGGGQRADVPHRREGEAAADPRRVLSAPRGGAGAGRSVSDRIFYLKIT